MIIVITTREKNRHTCRNVKIQEKCQIAMKFWGYKMATEADLSTENWNPISQWQIHAESST